ncbi:MAG: class B sortase [Lachnospiraceae bacterium]|mgnify:CR=1 FL=1|nr:class B sortase [Lachnospiraceae bacterium]
MEKNKKKLSAPLIVALVLCVALLGFSAFQLAGIYVEYKKGEDEYEALREFVKTEVPEVDYEGDEPLQPEEEAEPRVDFAELKALNEDIIGWIEVPDTPISYPIVQGEDDVYYLTHTFNNTENSAGSIFMETLNSADFSDVHTILYGHNMKNGSMFGTLMEYESPSYLVAHPLIFIDTEEGSHAYKIFSCYRVDADSDSYTIGFKADEMYVNFLKKLKERSAYDTGVEVTMDDKIITLSTCTNTGTNRYLVHAKKAW